MATQAGQTKPTRTRRDPADPDGMPPWGVAVPLGLQHVLAMFTSNLTPAILLAGVVGATTGEAVLLVQAALLCAGLATLLQTIGIGPVGSRLPLMMGSGFAFIAVAVPLAADRGWTPSWAGCWSPRWSRWRSASGSTGSRSCSRRS